MGLEYSLHGPLMTLTTLKKLAHRDVQRANQWQLVLQALGSVHTFYM